MTKKPKPAEVLLKFESNLYNNVGYGIVREEKVINAALNSDYENTLIEIKNFLEESYNKITFEIIDSKTVQNKGLLLEEVKSYFYKGRKPPLAEQLYDMVMRSEELQKKRDENNTDEKADSAELPAFLDDVLIMGIIANPNDDLKYNKKQIELYFSVHAEEGERGEYLKSAYQDRYNEIIVDGKRVGYKPQGDGLLMWEGAYLSRSAESVFSWGAIAGFTAELIDRKEYYVNMNIKGNLNPEVDIFRYVTEGTFDSYLYQLVENKQKFISQIMTSKTPLRAAEDVDETALSYSEIKALATGNPLIIEKCNLDMEVGKLNMLKANHLNQKYGLEEMVIRKYPTHSPAWK